MSETTQIDQEIKFFHNTVILRKGDKMPNALNYVPEDCQFTVGDHVEIGLDDLKLTDLQRYTQHAFQQWTAYLLESGLALELKHTECFMFDGFTVARRQKENE